MGYTWQTVEQAAVTLGCSTRTINRRVKEGAIESRLENGRREVLVCLPEDEPVADGLNQVLGAATETGEGRTSAPARVDDNAPARESVTSDTPGPPTETALALTEERARRAEMAVVAFRQTASLYQGEADRARLALKWAWAGVAVLAVVLCGITAWSASSVASARSEARSLSERARSAEQASAQRDEEARRLREEAARANEARARAEGELSATRANVEAHLDAARQASDRQSAQRERNWLEKWVGVSLGE